MDLREKNGKSTIEVNPLHEDPRYFYQGIGKTTARLKYALLSLFVCRGVNGKPQVNFSSLGGDLASSALCQPSTKPL